MKVRKRPVAVDAWKASELFYAMNNAFSLIPDVVAQAINAGRFTFSRTERLFKIETLEGVMSVGVDGDDWIICGAKGELYPCQKDIFDLTYEVDR